MTTTALRKFNLTGLALALLLVGACLLLAIPAVLTGNPLFAINYVSQRPIQAILYHEGEMMIFNPGSPEYDLLVEACDQTLYDWVGVTEMGWSAQRFEQARSEGTAVELIYAEPVQVPGWRVNMGRAYRLFFPLEVFGHQGEVVFRGSADSYFGLPIHVATLDRVRVAVGQITAEPQATR